MEQWYRFKHTYGVAIGAFMMLGTVEVFNDCAHWTSLFHFCKVLVKLDEDNGPVMIFGMIDKAWELLMDHIDIELRHEAWRQQDEALNEAQKAATFVPREDVDV